MAHGCLAAWLELDLNLRKPDYFAIPFLADGALAATMLMINLRAQDLGATALGLGWIGFAWALPYAVLSGAMGLAKCRPAPTKTLLAGALLYALWSGLCAASRSWEMLAGSTLLAGVATALFWPSFETLLHHADPAQTQARTGLFNTGWTLGLVAGSAAGGYLYHAAGVREAFALVGAASLLTAVYLRHRLNEMPLRPPIPAVSAPARLPAGQPTGRRDCLLLIGWTSNFAMFTATAAVSTLLPMLDRSMAISDGETGLLLATITLAQGAAFLLVSQTARWRDRFQPLWGALMMGGMGLMMMAWGRSAAALAVALAILGIARGVTYAISLFYALDSGHDGGRKTALHESIIATGMVLGPIIAGGAAQLRSLRAPFATLEIVVLVALVFQTALWRTLPGGRQWIATEAAALAK